MARTNLHKHRHSLNKRNNVASFLCYNGNVWNSMNPPCNGAYIYIVRSYKLVDKTRNSDGLRIRYVVNRKFCRCMFQSCSGLAYKQGQLCDITYVHSQCGYYIWVHICKSETTTNIQKYNRKCSGDLRIRCSQSSVQRHLFYGRKREEMLCTSNKSIQKNYPCTRLTYASG